MSWIFPKNPQNDHPQSAKFWKCNKKSKQKPSYNWFDTRLDVFEKFLHAFFTRWALSKQSEFKFPGQHKPVTKRSPVLKKRHAQESELARPDTKLFFIEI